MIVTGPVFEVTETPHCYHPITKKQYLSSRPPFRAFICVFDVTEQIDKVRENIRNARNQILNQGFPADSFLWVIAGNKIENSEERKTSVEQGQTLASDFSSQFFEVSAKNNKYVNDLFQMTVKWVNEKTKDDYEAKAKRLLETNNKKKEDKKECCIIF